MSTFTSGTTSTAFSSGAYRHVAMTISGSTHTLYLDGVQVATNTNAGNVFSTYSSLSNLYLGSAADLSFGYTGIIDDFKIWNRALPLADISAVYYTNKTLFYPTQISSLNNWYDASDPNGNGTIPTNGSSVSTWKDKSTNANHMLAQTAGTYATNNLNGLGTITFNQSWYRTTTANTPYPVDAYVVVKLNSITTPVDVLASGGRTVDNFNSLTFGEHTVGRWHNGSTNFFRTPNTVASSTYTETSTSFLLMSWSIANSNFYIYRNGVQIVYTNTYTWTPSSDNEYRIGARANASTPNNMQGSIAEILFFNTQLITSDRQRIEGYLAQKWGLQTLLPNDHPYRNTSV